MLEGAGATIEDWIDGRLEGGVVVRRKRMLQVMEGSHYISLDNMYK
jgi:hypothetical protein